MSYYSSSDDLYSTMTQKITTVDTSENSYIFNSLMPCATQISTFLLALDEVLKQVFASTAYASGYSTYLEKRVSEVGLTRKIATYASVPVTFTGKVGTVISQGTVVSTADNRYYTTISDVTIGSDGTAIVDVLANASGSTYNVNAGDINYLPVKLTGITSVTNPSAYNSAYNTETDAELYQRYLIKIQLPATSGNVSHYKEWALSVDGVGMVKIIPLWNGNGTVKVVISNSNRRSASQELINSVQAYIESQAPIGCTLTTESFQEVPLNINFTLTYDSSTYTLATITSNVSTSLTTYLESLPLGATSIKYNKILSVIMDTTGVTDIDNLTINNTTSNIVVSDTEIPILGTVTIN